jgi:hypothetical protein
MTSIPVALVAPPTRGGDVNMYADAAEHEGLFGQQDACLAHAPGDTRTLGDDLFGCVSDFGCGSEQCVALFGAKMIFDYYVVASNTGYFDC